jgi:hypothetical protein
MNINGLPAVSPSHTYMGSVSEWMGKLVSPLHASLLSKDGLLELAGRVKFIVGLVIVALIVIATKYHSSVRPGPNPSADTSNLTPRGPSTESPPATESPPDLTPVLLKEISLLEKIRRDAEDIDNAFNALLDNLQGLRKEEGEAFNKKVQDFYNTHDYLKDNPAFADAFKLVRFDENNYKFLLEMKGAIFFTKSCINDAGIVQTPSDGNCLFHTLGRGLALLEPALKESGNWKDFPFDHGNMREQINKWIIDNFSTDAQLRAYIDSAIIEYCPILDEQQERDRLTIEAERATSDVTALVKAYDEKAAQIEILKTVTTDHPGDRKAHETYITMTRDEGKFVSSPQIYAFCRLNPAVGVVIYRRIKIPGRNGAEPREITSKDFDLPFNPDAKFLIKPVYSIAGDHFDLYID